MTSFFKNREAIVRATTGLTAIKMFYLILIIVWHTKNILNKVIDTIKDHTPFSKRI